MYNIIINIQIYITMSIYKIHTMSIGEKQVLL